MKPSAAATLPRVTLALVAALDATWSAIREQHPDVPAVVVTLGAGSIGDRGKLRLGHFADARWQVDTERVAELFIGGEGLRRGPHDVLATLLHEAAHGIAATREIQDTSRQGRYHNAKFRTLAEEVGLTVAADPKLGWSPTALDDGTAERYTDQLDLLEAALVAYRHPEPQGGRGRNATPDTRVAAICGCGRKIRVTTSVLEAGSITCGLCGSDFAPA